MSSEELLRSLSWLFRIAAALFLAWLLLSRIASAEPTPVTGSEPAAGSVPTAADHAEAREVYQASCITCHGPNGDGDGLGAAGLPTKPANFTDPTWQKSVSDDEIARAIVGGGAVVRRSPLMPANPALAAKPGVVAALREMVRGFAKAKG